MASRNSTQLKATLVPRFACAGPIYGAAALLRARPASVVAVVEARSPSTACVCEREQATSLRPDARAHCNRFAGPNAPRQPLAPPPEKLYLFLVVPYKRWPVTRGGVDC